MLLFKILVRLVKHSWKELPYTVKSSIKTLILFSTYFEKILTIQRWKVVGVLHNPNGILRYAKLPNGHVKVVFSWSSGAIEIW